MRIEDFAEFEKDMQAFSFSQHQGFLSYFTRLTQKGWTIEDAKQWVMATLKKMDKDRRQTKRNQKIFNRKMLKCPKCRSTMFIRPVNIDNKTQTGDPKDKSVWICPNQECLHVIYNERTVKEILVIK